jgi:3-hydroxyisobutyrate dehydrogenase
VPEPTTVAVIGLGAMGSRIVGRLGGAGYDLVVWNRTPGKAAALPAREVETPAEAAAEAEALIVMVSDPAALEAVTDGPTGIAAGVSDSTTVIQMSTVGVAATARLAAALPSGMGLLDAPVLGSIGETESGALRIFVGGSAPLFERWTPLLSTLGTPVYVGPVGAGSAAKLVANTTLVARPAKPASSCASPRRPATGSQTRRLPGTATRTTRPFSSRSSRRSDL